MSGRCDDPGLDQASAFLFSVHENILRRGLAPR